MSGTTLLLATLLAVAGAQGERWVYRYDDYPATEGSSAKALAFGPDSGIYAAGYSSDSITEYYVVIGLSPAGTERWAYRY